MKQPLGGDMYPLGGDIWAGGEPNGISAGYSGGKFKEFAERSRGDDGLRGVRRERCGFS